MAQQAFLARQRRKLEPQATQKLNAHLVGEASSFVRRSSSVDLQLTPREQIRLALCNDKDRLEALFQVWDENGDGQLSEKEFHRAVKLLGVKAPKAEVAQFLAQHDLNANGAFSFDELLRVVNKLEQQPPQAPKKRRSLARRLCAPVELGVRSVFQLVSTTTAQTVLYFAFVMTTTHFLTNTLRIKEEYFLDKAMNDVLFSNVFDKDLNRFPNIRRIADVYEWGNQVLWPGLLGNGGPSCADAGHAGVFTSADPSPPASDRSRLCNDDTNSDGDGEFGRIGATAVTVQDVVRRMNSMDWTSGIRLFQVRVAPRTAAECRTFAIGDECLPEARPGGTIYSDAPYGRNWTAPTKPLSLAFRFHTAAELGSDPRGETTASPASFRTYPPDGFAAFVIPFFSTTYLPEERGPGASITDFQLTRATRQNGRTPRFLCVRLSWEGTHVHQLCDPNDPTTGATTGLVRAAIVEFWNDLKRARYLDDATRMFGITIPMASNNVGSQARVRIFFELTSSGALLPSYDSQTRILSVSSLDELELFLWIGLGFCAYFCMIEVVEILGLEDGTFDLDDVLTYIQDVWNITDWLCYTIYLLAWKIGQTYLTLSRSRACTSAVCVGVGFHDDYEVFAAGQSLKFYLSLAICLQLLKIMKIFAVLVPKMGLAPAVLKKALPDLVAFAGVFMISVLAFSSIFHLVLGSVMVDYNSKMASFISLSRALFGDFDINEVLDNSPSYLNTVIYLAYLFVAVFILLSMFLAILGEAQANLRDDQRVARKSAGGDLPSEYGVLDSAVQLVMAGAERMPLIGAQIRQKKQRLDDERRQRENAVKQVTPVDRIEARQLELQDKLDDAFAELRTGLKALGPRLDALSSPTATGSVLNGAAESAAVPEGNATVSPASTETVVKELQRLESLIVSMGQSATGTRRRRRVVKPEDSSPELVGLATKEPPPRQQGTRKLGSRPGSPTFLAAQAMCAQAAGTIMPLSTMEA